MQPTRRFRFAPRKLHTRTTILTTAVLVAVFAVVAYFSDLALTKLSDQEESHQAQLLATRVADTVEHHIKRQKIRNERRKGHERVEEESESTTIPDWTEVQEEIEDTIAKSNPQLSGVRVFQRVGPNQWRETVRMPLDAEPLSEQEQQEAAARPGEAARVNVRQQGNLRLITARASINALENTGSVQLATAQVQLTFDETQSSAAELRRLTWPLMLLAIIAVTLMTYFLFRLIVYKPIDNLLAAMTRAEGGDLAAEVEPMTPDEIGLLTSRFNRMLGRIRRMTEQLNLDQRRLEDRVREGTAEIAERKEQLEDANLRLFEMQRQLTQGERLAAAGQLAAQFAHEVGTPLNLISGHVQLLRARASDERVMKRLDVIAGQIERITNIVRSMLDSTRRPVPRLEAIDINALLLDILDATQPTLGARNVELEIDLREGLPRIDGDPDQLHQVFINLINNSLDAMPNGGNLRVTTAAQNDVVTIELSDNGEGIAEDQIELIFDPLFSTKRGTGTGLGLTIVRQVISEHNGSIEIESSPGFQTTVRISMPASRLATVPNQLPLTAARHDATLAGEAGDDTRVAVTTDSSHE